jgi:TPP-dependent indolepyruvate ferredoxin oxidoreductase alpha subunit
VGVPATTPAPIPRAAIPGRAARDPACAGCAQLGLFRALRRAGLEVQGGSGCDGGGEGRFAAASGAWAAVAGAERILGGAGRVLADAAAAGARVLVVADRDGAQAREAVSLLGAAGAAVIRVDAGDLAAVETAARTARETAGSALVALTACRRGVRRGPPLRVAAARCNRCGACLSLGCPAISDEGGEAMAVDPGTCSGCGLCAPLCRAGALAPR